MFHRLFTRRDKRRVKSPAAAPRFEALESRTLMTVAPPVAVLSDTRLTYIPKAMVIAANGDSIVAARSKDQSTYGSLFLARYAADGTAVWTLDTKITKVASDIRLLVAPDGTIDVLGSFAGKFDFDPGAGVTTLQAHGVNTFLLKLDSGGAFVSAQILPFGNAFAFDPDGNLIVAGTFKSKLTLDLPGGPTLLTGTSKAIVLASIDPAGNFLWASTLEGKSTQSVGNVVVDAAGKIYLVGGFKGKLDLDPTIAVNLVSTTRNNGFISRIDAATGSIDWIENIGGAGYAFATNLAINDQGDLAVIGNFNRLTDLDPTLGGTFNIASKGYLEAKQSESIFGFPVASAASGSSVNKTNLNNKSQVVSRLFTNVFIIHMHTDGTFVRADTMYSTIASSNEYLALDAAGNTYLTGPMYSPIHFRTGNSLTETTLLRLNPIGDAFAMKWNADGSIAWTTRISGPHTTRTSLIALDADGNLRIAGRFIISSPDFDPGAAVEILSSPVTGDFLWKLDAATGDFVDVTRI